MISIHIILRSRSQQKKQTTRWKVLQPATGTGKSQGLAVYCTMLADVDHPGVLIVTRRKAQADEIAETINKLAGREITIAYHGDNRVPVAMLSTFPVLVITHRAYEIGLDAINQGRQYASNWDSYAFQTGACTRRRPHFIPPSLLAHFDQATWPPSPLHSAERQNLRPGPSRRPLEAPRHVAQV